MKDFKDKLTEAFFKQLSRLPFAVLYAISDVAFLVVYHVMRYRRHVVAENLRRSFPEKTDEERRKIGRRFYRFLCDYAMETIKLLTIPAGEMKRRMAFEGIDDMERSLASHPFVFIYLGHYCNWEWVSSVPLWVKGEGVHCAQLYRPLKNKTFDRLFMHLRTRFKAENIAKYDTLRRILTLKKEGVRTIVGFISDQTPRRQSTHEWVNFLNQETPVFIGTERIGKKVDAAIYFADIRRVKRGYYACRFRLLTEDVRSFEDYKLTELYMEQLEEMIRRQPHLWLWSHKRWKQKRRPEEKPDGGQGSTEGKEGAEGKED